MKDGKERREYEREEVRIPFVYSLDAGDSLQSGAWHEGETIDIGPVLVGGLAFDTTLDLQKDQELRVALFMDLKQRDVWARDSSSVPLIYRAKVVRILQQEDGVSRVAVEFNGFVKSPGGFAAEAEKPISSS